MKKIYFLSFLFAAFTIKAQLVLTKSFNEPVIGDVNKRLSHDSTTAIMRTTGIGQVWDFTSLASNSFTEASTFTNVASTPSPAVFPLATLAEDQGNNYGFSMWKSSGSTWELQGIQFPGSAINFSNTAVFTTWPVSYGYNSTDDFAGSGQSGTTTATFSGSVTTNASGTGTVILPGGMSYTNCLQLTHTLTIYEAGSAGTRTILEQSYSYYHSSQKFPIITIRYTTNISHLGTFNSFVAFVNAMTGPAGLKEDYIYGALNVYPNPGNDKLTIELPFQTPAKIRLYNTLGKLEIEQSEPFIDLKYLAKGVYVLSVKQNDKVFTKRVIVE